MRWVLAICLCLLAALPLRAQEDAQDDKTYLEGWIEDALSDAGRNVTITGFQGALSSNATLDEMTISDKDGVWFVLRNASLTWSRRALLSGRLEVTELRAAEITLARLPKGGGDLTPSDAEAWEFALPELPVSVDIGSIRADKVVMSPEVIGEAATLSLSGALSLEDGAADAKLTIRRLDRRDKLDFTGSFSNATRVLGLDLEMTEAPGGLASTLLRIPGAPALGLKIKGEAPLSDYVARIALSTDDTPRFAGTVEIAATDEETGGYDFSADLGGDVRPLFQSDFHAFFGEQATLDIVGRSHANGHVSLQNLRVVSGAMEVDGAGELDPSGWPERFRLTAMIDGDGQTRLPFGGARVGMATLTAHYDVNEGETWQARAEIEDFARPDFRAERLRLAGSGVITREGAPSVTANVAFEAAGFRHVVPRLTQAIGPAPAGTARLDWQPGAPLDIGFLSVKSGDASLTASGQIDSLAKGFPVSGRAVLSAADLARFAALVGRDIAGSARARIEGTGTLLGGAFDIELTADTTDLNPGVPQLVGLLRNEATLALTARRDTGGTVLEALDVKSEALTLSASGRIDARQARLALSTRLTDIALAEPRLSGPAQLDADIDWQADGALRLSRFEGQVAGADISGQGMLLPQDPKLPVSGALAVSGADAARFARLLGRPLAGQVTLTLDGRGELRGTSQALTAEIAASGLRTGIAELDQLIAGDMTAETSLALDERFFDLRYLKLVAPRLRVNATGSGPGEPIAVSGRLSDLGLLAPGFGGPAAARGQIRLLDRLGQDVSVQLDANGPGGTTARIAGTIGNYGQAMALAINGSAPLGLANRFIAPRSVEGPARFDLRLEGPPQLSALSGQVTLAGARIALPQLNAALSRIGGTVTLADGRAETDITGTAGTGGTFRIRGPIALTAPYAATLELVLSGLGVQDPTLYRTTLDGTLGIAGPLTGGALITGRISLGATELRIPSGSGTAPGAIPDIRHVNEPAAVAATRRRAGLTGDQGGQMASFPLDVLISAPNRIFVRGRGLDAELGGQIRLQGSTSDVRPSGLFELIRGRLDLLGRRLTLTRGVIDLRGALDPYLRFVAETQAEDIVVRVILEGLASAPSVRFESEPDLPQEEAVARLLFGRGLDSISPLQAAELVAAAAALSGQRSGGLTGGLRSALGLSDLDVSSSEDGVTELKLGAYLSENIYSEVTADSEGKQEINLNLDLSSSVTVKGRANTEGDTGIGIFFEKDY